MLQFLQELALKKSILQHFTAYLQHKTIVRHNLETWSIVSKCNTLSGLYMQNFKSMPQFLPELGSKKSILQHFTAYLQHKTIVCHNLESWNLAWRRNICSGLYMQNFRSMLQFLQELGTKKAILQHFIASFGCYRPKIIPYFCPFLTCKGHEILHVIHI